jgi:hypothetical protein
MENIMESYMWLIVLIIAAPVLYVLNDKYRIMKFTKKELVEFAENNNIVVSPSKTKAEIVKQIRKK